MNAIVWQTTVSATFNMMRFVANPFAQFDGSTNFSAGHCHGKQSKTCAHSLPARPRENPPITVMIYRNLVLTPTTCSARSRRIASDLFYRHRLMCGMNEHLAG